MKTLKEHTLIYDKDCPMCRVYTGAFVKYGWLDGQGRTPYQQMPEEWKNRIDLERSQSEIALIDRTGDKVHYGVDALSLVIAHNMPLLKQLISKKWFRFLVGYFYFFISYNRKVIAAVKPSLAADRECTPAYNFKYRVAYLIIAWLFTSLVLNHYSAILSGLIPPSNFIREFIVCGGQMIFQGVVITILNRPRLMDYLGNMMTVSFIGALLLLPALLVHSIITTIPPIGFTIYFMMVVGVMLLEHFRRMTLLGLGWIPSATWVLYRLLVLALILL